MLRSEMAVRGKQSPGARPCEDVARADDPRQFYVVCDGVTRTQVGGVYPDPSPSALAARCVADLLFELPPPSAPPQAVAGWLRDAVAHCNETLAELNARLFPRIDHLGRDYAATVMVAGSVVGSKLHYAHLGDCALHLIRDGDLRALTRPQTGPVAEYRRQHGDSDAVTLRIRRDFRNHRKSPYGYGCLTGEPAAMDFVEIGAIELRVGDTLLFSSDGVVPAFDGLKVHQRPPNAAQLLDIAEAEERQRGLAGDDKAIVVVQVGASATETRRSSAAR